MAATAAPTTTSYSSIASTFLADLGAPDTPQTNAAVATWVRHESGGQVYSNNPWNIHYDVATQYNLPGVVGSRRVSNGEVVAVFSDLNTGIAASAKYISYNQHGYPKAVNALKAGDAIGFLNGIAASDWAGSHYGVKVDANRNIIGGTNSLIGDYISAISGKGSPGGTVVPVTGGNASGGANVGTGGGIKGSPLNTVPDGITFAGFQTDPAGTITKLLQNAVNSQATWTQWAQAVPVGTDPGKVDPGIYNQISKAIVALGIDPNSKITAADVVKVGAWAAANPITDPLTSIANTLSGLVSIITDPAKWVGILALGVGVALVGYGIVTLVRGYAAGPVTA